MAITNNNLAMIDRPVWEQLTTAPANSAAGSCIVDDNYRFLYYLISASSFWQYDTWNDTWMQLASPPGGTVAAGTCMRYVKEMGSQTNGVVYGSVYALIASGSAVVFYRYDIGTNTWSSALSVTNVPAAFGTDGRLVCPEPAINGFEGGYHSAVALNTITATSNALIGATSIAVSALPLALPSGAVLNFGTAAAPIWAVTTASAAVAATSITVSALVAQVDSGKIAYWYSDMFLTGNNATQIYRYNIVGNTWTTTSANSGTPALATATAALGAGHVTCWLPGSGDSNALNRLVILRGTASSTIYEYDLVTNTFSTITYYPQTETYTTGSNSGIYCDGYKNARFIIQKDITGRIYEFNRQKARMTPKMTQNLISSGTALVGDRSSVLRDPTGTICFYYFIPSTSAFFLRSPLINN